MKKYYLLLFSFLFLSINVSAKGIWDTTLKPSLVMDKEIKEEISCKDSECIGTYTIPENYDKDTVNIVPQVFAEPMNNVMPGDTYIYKINIINNSSNDYNYVAKSFYIEPFKSSDNINVTGYNGENINSGGVMYRISSSSALEALYAKNTKLSDDELSDTSLNKVLINKGYLNGLADLDKYILDYIKAESNTSLEDNAAKVASALWPNISAMPSVKETNPDLIAFGYNYFYNVLFSMHLNNLNLDDPNYAIGNWLRDEDIYNELESKLVNNSFLKNSSNSLDPLYFHINGPLTNNPYVLYEFGLDFGFKLTKVNPIKSDEIIIPEDKENVIAFNDLNDASSTEEAVNTSINSEIIGIIVINFVSLIILLFINKWLKKDE
jgi:hypothetical protein